MLDQTEYEQFLSSLFSGYIPHWDNNICESPNLHVNVATSNFIKQQFSLVF
jgi:hypothetical protein